MESINEEYYRTGKIPTAFPVTTLKALDALGWAQKEAAHGLALVLQVRNALVRGMVRNLEILGEDRVEVWKAVLKMSQSPDPQDRAAFCDAVKGLPGEEVDMVLLSMEGKERDPVVLATTLDALSARRSEEGFRRLVKRLQDPDVSVVVGAVRGITRYRRPDTVPVLAERLKTAEGRIFSDLTEALFTVTGKHLPDAGAAWEGWWKKEGVNFLRRWAPEVQTRLDEVEGIGLTDERLIDVAAELAALLPTETDAKVREAIIENLSIHKSDFARLTLIRALYDPLKGTRIAAIRGLSQYQHVSVPEELVRIVPLADDDEVQAIFGSLRALWGGPSEFRVDKAEREALLRWWDNNKDRVADQFLKLGARGIASGRKPPPATEAQWQDRNFYGLRVESSRVLFVVDVSLSMEEPAKKPAKGTATGDPEPGADGKPLKKIDVAKNELRRVLRSLPDGTQCGLVFFSATEKVWDQGMVVMGPDTRAKAIKWVDDLKTLAATNIYDALEEAFLIGTPKDPLNAAGPPDTIFFVSDGAPTAGKFLDPLMIRTQVKRWNAGRNIKIHVVGVGDDHDVVFCRNLAEENGGYYVGR